MSFQILISTVNAAFDACRAGVPARHCVVINQIMDQEEKSMYDESRRGFGGLVQVRERGLSRSRNRALKVSSADFCLFSDDDVVFPVNVPQRVCSAFAQYPDADIITFMAVTPEGVPLKSYRKRSFQHNMCTAGRVSSIEIALRRARVLTRGVCFDERFGLGSRFTSGEEYIFLADALRQGLHVRFVPLVVAIHPAESSGRRYEDAALVASKGAMLRHVYKFTSLFCLAALSLKKARQSEQGAFTLFMLMLAGWKAYGKMR